MVDQTLKDFTSDLESGERSASRGSVTDTVASAARELKDKAAELAGGPADRLKEQAADLAEQAKEFGSETAERLKDKVDERRGMGADYVGNVAETIRRAAGEFDRELPVAATYIRKAAAQVDYVSEALRDGDLRELAQDAQDFARRQPTVFFGLSLLAGFGLVRFLKSSGAASRSRSEASSDRTTTASRSRDSVDYAASMGGYGDGLAR